VLDFQAVLNVESGVLEAVQDEPGVERSSQEDVKSFEAEQSPML
jgi:hypothetical protein